VKGKTDKKVKKYYVVVFLDKRKVYQSSYLKKTSTFDEQGRFLSLRPHKETDPPYKKLKVAVYEKSMISLLDHRVGHFTIDITTLYDEYPHDTWYQVKKKDKVKVGLRCQLMYIPEEVSGDFIILSFFFLFF